jgi:hypothetical protein
MFHVEGLASELPNNLIKIDDASSYVGISKERLMSLVEGMFVPHYRIDGGEPLFVKKEIRAWVSKNLVTRTEGKDIHNILLLNTKTVDGEYPSPPDSISRIRDIEPVAVFLPKTGIYFLCYNGNCVYIGQSVDITERVKTHIRERRFKFDTAYSIAIVKEELDTIERRFIRLLNPIYNSRFAEKPNGALLSPDGVETIREQEWRKEEFQVVGQFGLPPKGCIQ